MLLSIFTPHNFGPVLPTLYANFMFLLLSNDLNLVQKVSPLKKSRIFHLNQIDLCTNYHNSKLSNSGQGKIAEIEYLALQKHKC